MNSEPPLADISDQAPHWLTALPAATAGGVGEAGEGMRYLIKTKLVRPCLKATV